MGKQINDIISEYEQVQLEQSSSGRWHLFNDGTDEFGFYNHAGTPEGNVTADIGSRAVDTTNGALYIKTTDSANTGWVAMAKITDVSAGITWNEETGTSATMAVNNGYIANNASLVTLTLPTTAAVGDIVRVAGKGAGLFRIAQNASEVIHYVDTDTTTGTGGSLTAIEQYAAIELVCTVADTAWTVLSSVGNYTVV